MTWLTLWWQTLVRRAPVAHDVPHELVTLERQQQAQTARLDALEREADTFRRRPDAEQH